MDKFCARRREEGRARAGREGQGRHPRDLRGAGRTSTRSRRRTSSFISAKCGDDNAIAARDHQNRSLNFSRAAELYKKQEYIPAAEAFYRFYKTAPQNDPDLPVALYNAAVSYKLADRPKTAIALFKEFTANTDKKFRESPYYLDAMRLTAASYQAAFHYDDAIKTYLELYDTTKKAKKLGIKPPEPLPGEKALTLEQIGLDALYNAAFAAELNRDFKKAVDLYSQYSKIEPDRRKQDRALWSIAGIYRQSGDVNNDDRDARPLARASTARTPATRTTTCSRSTTPPQLQQKKGRTPQAKAAEKATIDAWKTRGSVEEHRRARRWPASTRSSDAEEFYDEDVGRRSQIKKAATSTNSTRRRRRSRRSRSRSQDLRKKTEDKYIALDPVRRARGVDGREGPLRRHPVRPRAEDREHPDAEAHPEQRRGGRGVRERSATQALKKELDEAKPTGRRSLDIAKQGGVSNKWSQHALENLAREFPDEYKALRQELVQGTDAP